MSEPNAAKSRLVVMRQDNAYASAWTMKRRVQIVLWSIVAATLFRPTPKNWGQWRAFLLKLFGAKMNYTCFVAPSAVVKMPWNLVMENNTCLGPGSECYNLAPITLRARATVAQQAYLCAGTHDLSDPALPLVVGPIEIGADCFVGVRALILPGVILGEGAVVGGGAVVTRDVPAWTIVAGNPAREIGKRDHPHASKEPRTK